MRKVIPSLIVALQVLLLGLMVALVLAQANPLYKMPNSDGGLFMYMGQQILKGKLLYVDMWDHKGPLIFYINAFGLYLGQGYRWGVWGTEFIFVFFASFLGFKVMQKKWGLVAALFGTYLWLLGFEKLMRGGNFTEDYSLLFNFTAIYLFWLNMQKNSRWWRLFLIGVMLSLNFLLRANNIGVELSIVAVILISGHLDKEYQQSLKKVLWIATGSLFTLVIVAIYFLYIGTFEEMVVAGYVYNFFYSDETNILAGLIASLVRGRKLLGYILVPSLLGFLILFEKLYETFQYQNRKNRNFYFLLLIGWPLEMILSSLSGRNYAHYYICWLPYIAILSALFFDYIISPVVIGKLQKHAIITLSIAILLLVIPNNAILNQYQEAFSRILVNRGAGIEYIHPVARYIRGNTSPSDTVLVWGYHPAINLMAKRDSPTGVLLYPMLVDSPYTEEMNAQFLQNLIENQPKLIVDMVNPDNGRIPFIDPVLRETQGKKLDRFQPPPNLDRVFNYIFENYHVETIINDVQIYRINN